MIRKAIDNAATRMPLGWILFTIAALVAYWSGILEVIGSHFLVVANAPLLDLENVQSILTADEALAVVQQYNGSAQTLYLIFFILDTIFPPIVFGSFALLWAFILQRTPFSWMKFFRGSPILLIPFGVGVFDWVENLFFLNVIAVETANPVLLLQIGLVFVRLKAAMLFSTFGITVALSIIGFAGLFRRSHHNPSNTEVSS